MYISLIKLIKIQQVSGLIYNLELSSDYVAIEGFKDPIRKLRVEAHFVDNNSVRVRILDQEKDRFEVPVPVNEPLSPATELDKVKCSQMIFITFTVHYTYLLFIEF